MGEPAGFAKAFGAMPFSSKQISRMPCSFGRKVRREFPTFAVRDAGEDAWPFLRASMPPASTTARLTLAHLQLHEHGACEFVKNDDSESRLSKGSRGQATPDAEFRLWTHQLCPFLAENVA